MDYGLFWRLWRNKNKFPYRDTCNRFISNSNGFDEPPEIIPKVLPNPTKGKFTLWFAVHDKPGWVEIYDTNGKCIRTETVVQWSQCKQMDITYEPPGIYFCRMRWGIKETNTKIVKQ